MAKRTTRRTTKLDRGAVCKEHAAKIAKLEAAVVQLSQTIDKARITFARLAAMRAADMVLYQGKDWDDGAHYINMEVQSLDQHLGIAAG